MEAGVDAVLRGGAGRVESRTWGCKLLLGLDGDAELRGASIGGRGAVPALRAGCLRRRRLRGNRENQKDNRYPYRVPGRVSIEWNHKFHAKSSA